MIKTILSLGAFVNIIFLNSFCLGQHNIVQIVHCGEKKVHSASRIKQSCIPWTKDKDIAQKIEK